MLDLKFVREHPELVKEDLRRRQRDPSLVDQLLEMDQRWRISFAQQSDLRAGQNRRSEEVARKKKSGEEPSSLLKELRQLSEQIRQQSEQIHLQADSMTRILEKIPNSLHPSVPEGTGESGNIRIRSRGLSPSFSFSPLPHWELAKRLELFDLERSGKIAGSGFILYTGWGAKLERSLISWMIDFHCQHHGYRELFPPFVINRDTAYGTGKLPDFDDQMYRFQNSDLYLNPTAEVPVTALHAGEILQANTLPRYYVAYTACFRREAGAAGKDTRGLLRLHQFDKVELVKFVRPEDSYQELENLTSEAESIVAALELPYEVVELCTGEIGFSASKAYDINVFAPGANKWLEVSSCSNCTNFQSRRLNTRFRNPQTGKLEFVHTLNGSGVALPRTVAAILENNQEVDGSVRIPRVLQPYLQVERIQPGS
jgi:seryl-tRNA synthetase